MLRQLSIRNFLLIDRLDIEFDAGLTALTGETGAGKSIVLDALGLALGARAEAGCVRAGARQADITAEFIVPPGYPVAEQLGEYGDEADGALILRRTIDAGGRSRSQINGRPVTLAEVRAMAALLLEIHAQHEHQALLVSANQRDWLDRFAGATALALDVQARYRAWREADERWARAQTDQERLLREREALAAELVELRALSPSASEWEALASEQTRLAHARELLETVAAAEAALTDDDGLLDQTAAIAQRLQSMSRLDARLVEPIERLQAALAELGEAQHGLRAYRSRLSIDPERLAEVEERLAALHAAARRLKVRPESLEQAWREREARLVTLAADTDLACLEAERDERWAAFISATLRLTEARRVGAGDLSAKVTADLPELALATAEFEVALVQTEPGVYGGEQVEFRFRSHPSLPLAPLSKVASGGELARLALAILVACGDRAGAPTLIFDEVDVGVGGRVAAQVGRRLQTLASSRQVLAVTHMPQVAAHADHHLQVSRDNERTPTTSVRVLEGAERDREIARMLAGHEEGPATLRLARQLLRESGRPNADPPAAVGRP